MTSLHGVWVKRSSDLPRLCKRRASSGDPGLRSLGVKGTDGGKAGEGAAESEWEVVAGRPVLADRLPTGLAH